MWEQTADDFDLAQQCASQLERMGHPRFSRYEMCHVGGDPAVSTDGATYSAEAAHRELIMANTTEQYVLCSNLPDCY